MRALSIGLVGSLMLAICGCQTAPVETRPSWLGINTMLGYPDFEGAFPSAKTTPAERERYFQLLTDLGAPPVRDLVMSWARAQIVPGAPYDFSISDELVQQAQKQKVDMLALCCGTPGWATGRARAPLFDFGVPGREHEEQFRRFVRAFVERYDGDGLDDMPELKRPLRAYEFLQEMEDIAPDEYAHWLRLFYGTVKEADPLAVVSLGSLRSPGLRVPNQPRGDYPTYLERLLSSSELSGAGFPCFDAVSLHSYPGSTPDKKPFEESIAYVRQTLAGRALARPIWLTEFGCDGRPGAEEQQAARLIQWALRAKALGVERAYIYCLWDHHWSSDRSEPEYFGMVREAAPGETPVRKTAFSGVATLVKALAERPEVTPRSENVYMLAGGKEATTYVIWQDSSVAGQQQHLNSGWWELQTLDGQKMRRQGNQVELTAAPMFVTRAKSPFLDKSPFLKDNSPLPGLNMPDEKGTEKEKAGGNP